MLRKYKVLTKIKDVLFMCYILHKGVSGMASDGKIIKILKSEEFRHKGIRIWEPIGSFNRAQDKHHLIEII